MIALHRLGHGEQPFLLNSDLIFTIEANPDTVITLTTGLKIVVDETPEEVADAVREWRVEIMTGAFNRKRPGRSRSGRSRGPQPPPITAVDSESTPA